MCFVLYPLSHRYSIPGETVTNKWKTITERSYKVLWRFGLQKLLPEIILTLPYLPDLPDLKYLYQSISEKGKVNFNGFPIFSINWVHIYQSISDTWYTYLNKYPIYLLFNFNKQKSINSGHQSLKLKCIFANMHVYVC